MIVDKLYDYLNEHDIPGKERTFDTTQLRGSQAGKCAAALGYARHGYEAKPLNARARLVFDLGDTIEDQFVNILTSESFREKHDVNLTRIQEEVSIEVDGEVIKGHIDGVAFGDTLVDFKSINTRGFSRVQKTNDIEDYRYQMNFYMHALGLKKCIVVYYNKDTSHLHEVNYYYDPSIVEEILSRFRAVIHSTKDNLPDREYAPNSKGKLPWQCSYCSYCELCWPDYELSFDSKHKPVLKVRKEIA